MNNADKLRQIKQDHDLTWQAIAELCGVSIHTVHSWTAGEHEKKHRAMHERHLKLLQLQLQDDTAEHWQDEYMIRDCKD